jgi:hypothetical protein
MEYRTDEQGIQNDEVPKYPVFLNFFGVRVYFVCSEFLVHLFDIQIHFSL